MACPRRQIPMKRRDFIKVIGGGAAAWPLVAHAQPAKLPTIGFLGAATPSMWSQLVVAFVQRLRDLGWSESRNVAIEFRWAEGRTERYTEIATELRWEAQLGKDRSRCPPGRAKFVTKPPPTGSNANAKTRCGDWRNSGSGPHARLRSRNPRNPATRGHCTRFRDLQGPNASALHRSQRTDVHSSGSNQQFGVRRAARDDFLCQGIRRSRSFDVVWIKLCGFVPKSGRICR